MNGKIKGIVFDLDDTLIDTSGLLVPKAIKKSFLKMIEQGLPAELSELETGYKKLSHHFVGIELFQTLVTPFVEPKEAPAFARLGFDAFLRPDLPEQLPLLPGAPDLLEQLQTDYELFLVTQGHEPTQKEKIKKANLESFFKSVRIADLSKGQTKTEHLAQILKDSNYLPEQVLSIGDRLSIEIFQSQKLGMRTCHFYRKDLNRKELGPFGSDKDGEVIPDFVVHSLTEVRSKCRV